MSNQLLASKTVVNEAEPDIRTIVGTATAIASMVGITKKGTIGKATRTTSFAEWVTLYGNDIAAGFAASAVRGFYQNGGQELWFTRTVHYTDIDVAATETALLASLTLKTPVTAATAGLVLGSIVGPFSLAAAATIIVNVDTGGNVTATFDAAAASRTSGNTETFDLTDGLTLTVAVDGGGVQTATFDTAEFADITNATALEVAAVLNAELTGLQATVAGGAVILTSDVLGTDSGIDVTGGTANSGGANRLAFATGNIAGTGDVADISQVSVAEIKTVLEADIPGLTVNDVGGAVQIVSNTTGVSSTIAVDATSTADTAVGLDNATHAGTSGLAVNTLRIDGKYKGTYANALTVLIGTATSGIAGEFNLTVIDGGVVVEVFPNLSMADTAPNYAETLINDPDTGSNYIAVVDLDANPANEILEVPANSPGAPPVPFGPLAGGGDGLAGLVDNDFIGSDLAKNGIRAFDTINDIRLLMIPDRPTAAVQGAMITYAEVIRDLSMFAILDSPAGFNRDAIVTYVETTASLLNLSEFGMMTWPQVNVVNPSETVFGTGSTLTVPPSGHVAGMIARVDGARPGGVYDPPAGVERGTLAGVVGFETDAVLEEATRDIIYPKRINPITRHPGQPIALDGVRTLKGGSNFPTVAERRGVIFIEQALKNGLEFARLANNDEALRARVERSITNFLTRQMKLGAFRSKNPETAFFVDVSEALNPPSEVFAGKLNVRIGLATQKPAEFIILQFSQDTRALDEELAATA